MSSAIARELLAWYDAGHRPLPWRNTTDPYKIWLSEVILQQTRVAQGTAYYHALVETFPDVASLASASEQQVLKLWQGLGYYSRARNLHAAARRVMDDYGGVFPETYAALLTLPGIGSYTAAAIASIAFGECVPAIDGNAIRVLSRLFAIGLDATTAPGKRLIAEAAASLMGTQRPGDFNQSVMELGATLCTPAQPACVQCPVLGFCEAAKMGQTSMYPIQGNAARVVDEYIWYYVLVYPGQEIQIAMQKRGGQTIWRNLWDFPAWVQRQDEGLGPALSGLACVVQTGQACPSIRLLDEATHLLTHRKLHIRYLLVEIDHSAKLLTTAEFFTLDQASYLPVPKPIEKFLQKLPSLLV